MKRWTFFATACVAVLAGCEDNPLETDCCRLLTRIEMTPDAATVAVGDSVQFTAIVYDEDDVAVETDILWQVATGARGSVAQSGWFEAASTGSTYVRAVVGALRDSSLVTITP